MDRRTNREKQKRAAERLRLSFTSACVSTCATCCRYLRRSLPPLLLRLTLLPVGVLGLGGILCALVERPGDSAGIATPRARYHRARFHVRHPLRGVGAHENVSLFLDLVPSGVTEGLGLVFLGDIHHLLSMRNVRDLLLLPGLLAFSLLLVEVHRKSHGVSSFAVGFCLWPA